MNLKQEELVEGLEKEIKEKFPEVTLLGHYEGRDRSIRIEVATPTDNGWEIGEMFSGKCLDILLDYGHDILVLPMENVKDPARLMI